MWKLSEEIYKWGGISPGLLRNMHLDMEVSTRKYFLREEKGDGKTGVTVEKLGA